jgi:hypothetical protein
MCHHPLKCVVCERHLFLGCVKIFSERFSAQKMQGIFLCSEIKTSYLPHPKGCGLISDIIMIINSVSLLAFFQRKLKEYSQ